MNEIVVETTGQVLRFPDPREEARVRAEEFQRLSSETRFRGIFAMIAFGLNMAHSSPRWATIEQRWLEDEQAFSRSQQAVFAKHG